jgi:hypothetical protein
MWTMLKRLFPQKQETCSLDDWTACRQAMCSECQYPARLKAAEADLAALEEDRARLIKSNRSLFGQAKKYWQLAQQKGRDA